MMYIDEKGAMICSGEDEASVMIETLKDQIEDRNTVAAQKDALLKHLALLLGLNTDPKYRKFFDNNY